MDAPRANRDPANVKRKLERLGESHVAPLAEFVERLCRTRPGAVPGVPSVPYIDPDEAGVGARVLLLLKDPAASGPRGSGFVSSDNDDNSAETMWWALRRAGVDRAREVLTWNIIPWYRGVDAPESVRAREFDEAQPALLELLELLPNARAVVLLGRDAERGWKKATGLVPDVPTTSAPHPAARMNGLNKHTAIAWALAGSRELAGLA